MGPTGSESSGVEDRREAGDRPLHDLLEHDVGNGQAAVVRPSGRSVVDLHHQGGRSTRSSSSPTTSPVSGWRKISGSVVVVVVVVVVGPSWWSSRVGGGRPAPRRGGPGAAVGGNRRRPRRLRRRPLAITMPPMTRAPKARGCPREANRSRLRGSSEFPQQSDSFFERGVGVEHLVDRPELPGVTDAAHRLFDPQVCRGRGGAVRDRGVFLAASRAPRSDPAGSG